MLPSALAAALASHDHLVTLEVITRAGFSHAELTNLVRRGHLVRVRHSVYTSATRWEQAESTPERELLRARAASLTMIEPHVLSHDSAAYALGMSFLAPLVPMIHVTRHRVLGSRSRTGIKHHAAPYAPELVVRTPHGPVLDLARTACDIAREHGPRTGLTACDSAMRLGATRPQLEAAAAAMRSWAGVTSVRQAIANADPGAENPAESLTRLLVTETGFGVPDTQFPVRLGEAVAWCDVRIGRHVVEFDGRLKYRRRDQGGVATDDPGDVAWAERRRESAIIAAGFGVSRVAWDDLLARNWERTRARLTAEIATTKGRSGMELEPAMEAFAVRMGSARRARIFAPRSA